MFFILVFSLPNTKDPFASNCRDGGENLAILFAHLREGGQKFEVNGLENAMSNAQFELPAIGVDMMFPTCCVVTISSSSSPNHRTDRAI